MEKPPIINNIKEKLKLNQSDTEDFDSEDNGGENDVLDFYRIPLSIDIPEDVLTPKQASAVRFSYSKPKGFHPTQVEEFYADVVESLQFYVKALEVRDRNVHRLATEVDKYKTDFQNIKFQLEMFQGLGQQAVVKDDGSYATESDLGDLDRQILKKEEEIQKLRNELLLTRKDKEIAEMELAEARSAAPALPSLDVSSGLSNEDREELEAFRQNQQALDEWAAEVTKEYERLENEAELLRASSGGDTSALNDAIAERDAYIAEIGGSLEQAQKELATVTSQLEEANESVEYLREEVAGYVNHVEELGATISSLEKDSGGLEAAAAHAQELLNKIGELHSDLEIKEEQLGEAVKSANDIEAERVHLESEQARLEAELAELRQNVEGQPDTSGEVESLTAHIKSLDAHIDSLMTHIEALEADSVEKEKLIGELEEAIGERDAKIEELERNSGGVVIPGFRELPPDVRPEDLLG